MSVILESQSGDTVVCIEEFNASPAGQPFSWDTSQHFSIGEELTYLGSEQHQAFKDRPNGWMVRFESRGQTFLASQTYFIGQDAWRKIAEFFQREKQSQLAQRN